MLDFAHHSGTRPARTPTSTPMPPARCVACKPSGTPRSTATGPNLLWFTVAWLLTGIARGAVPARCPGCACRSPARAPAAAPDDPPRGSRPTWRTRTAARPAGRSGSCGSTPPPATPDPQATDPTADQDRAAHPPSGDDPHQLAKHPHRQTGKHRHPLRGVRADHLFHIKIIGVADWLEHTLGVEILTDARRPRTRRSNLRASPHARTETSEEAARTDARHRGTP